MDISFILPTNRNYERFGNRVIDNINGLNFNGLSYEIIVVSPQLCDRNDVIYVKDPVNSFGCVPSYNLGYNTSTGNYIVLCSDDHIFNIDMPNIIKVLESDLFSIRTYKIVCLPTNNHGSCKLPDYACDGLIARYPVFSRDTIDNYLGGYIYHPSFAHHYPDNWLGYWLTMNGEPVIEYDRYDMLTFSNSCYNTHDSLDESTFRELIDKYNKGYMLYV